jgi:branched-chain amino acid transport system substrate-binding protein
MRYRSGAAAIICAIGVLALGACSSSHGATGSTSAAASSPASGSAGKFSNPLKIAGLFDIQGEDSYSDNSAITAVQLAVDDINAHGGVGGLPVEFTRYKMTYDPSTALTGLLQAEGSSPSAIIGIDTTSILAPLEQKLATGPAPVLSMVTDPASQSKLSYPNNLFAFRAPPQLGSAATTQYLVDKFKPATAGLICVSDPFGTANCNADAKVLDSNRVKIVGRVVSGITSTDETTQAQAMRGADIVLDEGYPGPIVLDVKAMTAEGLNVPVSAGASIAYATQGLTSSQLSRLYGYADCLPETFTSPPGSTVEAQYVAKMHQPMGGYTAHFYDAVMMVAQAARLAGSPDPKKIAAELRTMSYKGICSTYQAHQYQIMAKSADITQPRGSNGFVVVKQGPR